LLSNYLISSCQLWPRLVFWACRWICEYWQKSGCYPEKWSGWNPTRDYGPANDLPFSV